MATLRRKSKLIINESINPKSTECRKHIKSTSSNVIKDILSDNFLTAGDVSHDIVKLYNGRNKHLSLRQSNALLNDTEIKNAIPKCYLAKVHLLVSTKPHYRYIKSGVYKQNQTKFGSTKWQTVVSLKGYIKFMNDRYQRNGLTTRIYNQYKDYSKLALILKILRLKNRIKNSKVNNNLPNKSRHYVKTPSKIVNLYNKRTNNI